MFKGYNDFSCLKVMVYIIFIKKYFKVIFNIYFWVDVKYVRVFTLRVLNMGL
jgi:hypothetical protein